MLLSESGTGSASQVKLRITSLAALIVTLILAPTILAQPVPHTYVETFETTTYMDPVESTAFWNVHAGVLTIPMEITPLGTLGTGTSCLDICVSGNYTLVAARTGGLLVVDTTNPTLPTVVGTYDNTRDIRQVAMDGDHAVIVETFTFSSIGYWRILDISDPANPVSVGGPDIWAAEGNDIAIEGDLCLIANDSDDLAVIDMTNVTAPDVQPTYSTTGSILGVAIQGSFAYIGGSDNFEVLDVRNPASVTRVGFLATPNASQVAVDGRFAYVITSNDELRIINISDPASPTLISVVPAAGASGVCVNGNWAYVAGGNNGVHMFDISDPTAPLHLLEFDTGGFANRCRVDGNMLHVADGAGGYRLYAIANLLTPPEVSESYSVPNDASDVAVTGGLALMTEYGDAGLGPGRLHVVDIRDHNNVHQVGLFDGFAVNNKAVGVAGAGNLACVLTDFESTSGVHSSILHTIDISDPGNPVEMDSIGFAANARAQCITMRGHYAYCGCRTTGVTWGVIIIDVSNPYNLAVAGHAPTLDRDVTDIELVDNSLFLTEPRGSTNERFQVLDVTNPIAPTAVWSGYLGFGIDDVCVTGNHACTVGPAFYVWDVTNPFTPTYATWISTAGQNFRCLEPAGRYVAVDMDVGFGLVDFHTPTSPVRLPDVDHSGNIGNLVIAGDYAYGASSALAPASYSGMRILRIFEHGVDQSRAWGQSLTLDSSPLDIYGARITPDQEGYVLWDLSADGGLHWEPVNQGAGWHIFQYSGSDLRWRAYLDQEDWRDWPVVETLTVEWHHTDVSATNDSTMPSRFALLGGKPNPFNARTTIGFDVPPGGGEVILEIYNVRGQRVRRLTGGFQAEGHRSVTWDGRDDQRRQVSGGIYYCRMQAQGFDETRKVSFVP